MIYAYKEGARHTVSAQIAGETCSALEKEGRLNAQTLVDVSRPDDAPLHEEFEWDDSVAGEEWRKHQARNIINTIVIVPEVEEKPIIRAYYKIQSSGSNYESLQTIIRNKDKHQELLEQAKREFESYKAKYTTLKELDKLFEAGASIFKDVA